METIGVIEMTCANNHHWKLIGTRQPDGTYLVGAFIEGLDGSEDDLDRKAENLYYCKTCYQPVAHQEVLQTFETIG